MAGGGESQRERAVVIDTAALNDPTLSFRAKGLLAYLQSLPRGAIPDPKRLEGVSLEKRAAIESALQELVDRGYLIRNSEAEEAPPEVSPHKLPRAVLMESLFGEPPRQREDDRPERRSAKADRVEMAGRVQRIIDHLNALRERSWEWAQYTPLSAKHAKNVEHIRGRLHDGYTDEDLILVLDYLAATDGGKEESRRYFNCVTPFNTKNFERNLAMARDWDARRRPGAARARAGTSRGKAYYLGAREERG